jgi:hypothetical protein
MAIHGWSVIGLTETEGHALEDFDEDQTTMREQLTTYVEASEPRGAILRGPFANELAVGNFVTGPAADLEEVSLSIRAVKDLTEAAVAAAGKLEPPKPPKGVKRPKPHKPIKSDAASSLSPEGAQIVLSMTGSRLNLNMTSLTLQRLADDGTEVVYDGMPTTTSLGGNLTPKFRKTDEGDMRRYDFVVEVTPGIWKISTIGNGAFAADLCFGAPALMINAGETLYLGEMALSGEGGYPLDQSSLGIARAILADAPAIAERVQVAALTNGFTSDCFGSYAYAYDQPGAPFLNQP